MIVQCPTCQVGVPADKLDFSQLLATCAQCANVFSLTDGLVDRRSPGGASGPRPPLPLPAGMTREKVAPRGGYRTSDKVGSLRLTRTTRSKHGQWFVLGVFALGGPAFAIWILSRSTDPTSIVGSGFAFLVAALAVWVLLSILLNTTSIEVDAEHIKIRTGPVPTWGENIDLMTADVAQLIVTERRRDDSVSYSVVARLESGQFVDVIRNVPSRAQADYIEREIEELLEIEDEDPTAALAPRTETAAAMEAPPRVRVAALAGEDAAATDRAAEEAAIEAEAAGNPAAAEAPARSASRR